MFIYLYYFKAFTISKIPGKCKANVEPMLVKITRLIIVYELFCTPSILSIMTLMLIYLNYLEYYAYPVSSKSMLTCS